MGLWQWGYPKAAIQMGQKSTEFGSITILKTNPYVSMAKFDKYVPQTNTKTNYPYKLWFSKVRGDSIPIQSPWVCQLSNKLFHYIHMLIDVS